jgi:hypothetical protein
MLKMLVGTLYYHGHKKHYALFWDGAQDLLGHTPMFLYVYDFFLEKYVYDIMKCLLEVFKVWKMYSLSQ